MDYTIAQILVFAAWLSCPFVAYKSYRRFQGDMNDVLAWWLASAVTFAYFIGASLLSLVVAAALAAMFDFIPET